ncbi:DUF488 domain-containing protein [Actinopolymorpha pittospori]
MGTPSITTFGHGTATEAELAALLAHAGIHSVVDVRTAPGSRRSPHVGRAELERWLPLHGISYRWEKRLGGFRKLAPDSPDVVWRNSSFRAYAGHMRTEEFLVAVDALLAGAAEAEAIMCSESLWWRCHRRMIADFLQLARGVEVHHLLPDGTLVDHQPTAGVRLRQDGLLVYDNGQLSAFDDAPTDGPPTAREG